MGGLYEGEPYQPEPRPSRAECRYWISSRGCPVASRVGILANYHKCREDRAHAGKCRCKCGAKASR